MSSGLIRKIAVTMAAFGLFCFVQQRALAAGQWAAPPPASAFTIPTAQLIQADELNRLLHTRGAEKPLILQVGSRMMFAQAHIPGAEYAGAGSQAEGVAAVARPRCVAASWNLHRPLLRLLPLESLPQRRPGLQPAPRYGIHACKGPLSCRKLRQRLGQQRVSR